METSISFTNIQTPPRCLVTGANGFVGAAVVRALLQRGASVTAMVRRDSNITRLRDLHGLTIIYGDLGALPFGYLRTGAIDVCYHIAWWGTTGVAYQSRAQFTTNLNGSITLMDALLTGGCRAMVALGSQAEYGVYDQILHEDLPLQPQTAYAVSKVAACQSLAQMCALSDARFVWLRLFAAYGAGDDPARLLPYVAETLRRGEIPLLTSGEQRWDYLHIDDVAAAIADAGLSNLQGIYNLCSGKAPTLHSIISQLRDIIAPQMGLGFGQRPYAPNQIMWLQGDNSRLCHALDWQPRVRLDEGLARL
jgi:UDP-glucose 4-epimerase